MPHFFLDQGMRADDRVAISGPLFNHLKGSLRVRSGAQLELVDAGQILSVQVEAVTDRELSGRVTAVREAPPEPVRITLAVGMPKGRKLEEVVQKAVELGVFRVVPVVTERSISRPEQGRNRTDRLHAIALEAAQQSRRAYVPEVAEPLLFSAYIMQINRAGEGTGGAGRHDANMNIMLWEREENRSLAAVLAAIPASEPTEITLFIGPEGGISAGEARALMDCGFVSACLGPHILRTETACIAALAVTGTVLENRHGKLDRSG